MLLSSSTLSIQLELILGENKKDDSPNTESTVTVSSPSQETWTDTEESEVAVAVDLDIDVDPRYAEKETQTVAGVFLSEEDYELLVRKAEHYSSFKEDLLKLRQSFSSGSYNPEMDTD